VEFRACSASELHRDAVWAVPMVRPCHCIRLEPTIEPGIAHSLDVSRSYTIAPVSRWDLLAFGLGSLQTIVANARKL